MKISKFVYSSQVDSFLTSDGLPAEKGKEIVEEKKTTSIATEVPSKIIESLSSTTLKTTTTTEEDEV